MYCPKCNQQQPSEEMRYCSRCGFALTGVAQLLANDGVPPVAVSNPNAIARTSRRKIISESAYLTLIAWAVAFAAFLLVDFGGPLEPVALIAGVIFFFVGLIGLIRFIYGFLFVKDAPQVAETVARPISAPAARAALPPTQSIPISDYPRRTQTKEIVPPPSITENTTKLLDENIIERSE